MHERPLPAWFDDAKLGIFIHWGVFAVPAYAPLPERWPLPADDPKAWTHSPYSEGYADLMQNPGSPVAHHHAERYGPGVTYDDFAAQFRDECFPRWQPETWAELFARAGARYVVITTKIEDGFLMWPSAHPNPHKPGWGVERDLLGELRAALSARGIRLGFYYPGLDATFSDHSGATSLEELDAAYPRGEQFAGYVESHWRELIERYEPAVLWADFGYPADAAASPDELFRRYYERVPDGVVNDRFDEGPDNEQRGSHSDFRTFEFKLDFSNAPTAERKWEACRGIGWSFGWNREETDADYASSADLIRYFADIVARGGNFLLNMGPTATGEPPWEQARRLSDIGWWLARYGGAIYGTRRWERPTGTTGDGLDVRYTASGDAVHAIVLGTPAAARVELDVRLDDGAEVRLEDRPLPLRWEPSAHGIVVELPEQPDEQPAIALRLSPREAVRANP